MSNVLHVNVEVERFDSRNGDRLVYDVYNKVSGYAIDRGVLTVVDLDGEDVWSYEPDQYETVSYWEVLSDGA